MSTATKISAKLIASLLFFTATSPALAQGGLEFPKQIRQQPAGTNQIPARASLANQRGSVAQASYQPIEPVTREITQAVDIARTANTGSGFPTLTPSNQPTAEQPTANASSFGPLVTTSFSLAVVLGLFAGLVWISRRYGNGSMTQSHVPSDVLKSLGTTAIDARTQVTMLRCGNRIIVIAQTANGVHPLSEITDPAEVNRLTLACTGDTGPTFAETLQNEPRGQLFASA